MRPARVEDAAAIAAVHVRTWQAAYEHALGKERLAAIDLGAREEELLGVAITEVGYRMTLG